MERTLTVDWPWTNERPSDSADVRVLFTGMMMFTHKTTAASTEGQVVFHRGTPNHHLRILVLEDCVPIFAFGGRMRPSHIGEIDLGIIDEDSRAVFYKNGDFVRRLRQGDDKDFRWLLDLEGPDFHNGKFVRNQNQFSTKLIVRHGTFYTYKHTGHYFRVQGGLQDGLEIGYVPKVVGLDIKLEDGDCVSMQIDGRDALPYPLCKSDAKYEIYLSNECEANCDIGGDFPLVWDAVNVAQAERFNLLSIGGQDNGQTDDTCLPVPFSEGVHLNDEAPCMGGGLGTGGGFP
jgi:hypothetical protein